MQIPGQLYPCNGHSWGRRGAAASSRGNSDTLRVQDPSDDRGHGEYLSASWNVVVLDLALHYSSFSPYSWQHTPQLRIWSDSMGFQPGNLLFLEPVLLQPSKGSQAGVCRMRLAATFLVVEVRAAGCAQPSTIALANHFHRQRQ